jgi:hypothetical protein
MQKLELFAEPMQDLAGAFEPPTEGSEDIDPGSEQRDPHEEEKNVAEEDDNRREDVTLIGDIRLFVFEDVPGERHMEGVSGAEKQVKPGQVRAPVPHQMTDQEPKHHENGIQRKEIGSEGDEKIGFRHDDVAAAGGGFKFFDATAEEPGPEGMSEFMAEDVDPHGPGKEQVDHGPASDAGESGDPGGIGRTAGAHHHAERPGGTRTGWQQQQRDDGFDPLGHAHEYPVSAARQQRFRARSGGTVRENRCTDRNLGAE